MLFSFLLVIARDNPYLSLSTGHFQCSSHRNARLIQTLYYRTLRVLFSLVLSNLTTQSSQEYQDNVERFNIITFQRKSHLCHLCFDGICLEIGSQTSRAWCHKHGHLAFHLMMCRCAGGACSLNTQELTRQQYVHKIWDWSYKSLVFMHWKRHSGSPLSCSLTDSSSEVP